MPKTLIASIFLIISLAMPAQATLINNGNFEACTDESGNPVSSSCNGWSFDHFAAVNDGIGVSGSKGVRLESGGSGSTDPTAIQSVTGLDIGQAYRLSWSLDLRVNFSGSGNGPSFGVFLDDQTFADALHLSAQLSNGFIDNFVDFFATSTSHTFIFAGELDARSNGGGTTDVSYNLDNVDLVALPSASEMPEPSTMLLFTVGLLGLMVTYRSMST
jgi:hypothetical protein